MCRSRLILRLDVPLASSLIMILRSVIVVLLFAISSVLVSSFFFTAKIGRFYINNDSTGLILPGGTFHSVTGGTFETVMTGTFHSATGGTFVPVMGGTFNPLPSPSLYLRWESSTQNRMQETVSQDSVHVSQLRLDSVIVERYFTVETIRDTVYIKQESNKQHFSILRDTVYVARSDAIVREVEVIKEKEVVKTAPQRKSFKSYLICIFASILLFLAIYFLIRSRFRLWVSKCQTHFDSTRCSDLNYYGLNTGCQSVKLIFIPDKAKCRVYYYLVSSFSLTLIII